MARGLMRGAARRSAGWPRALPAVLLLALAVCAAACQAQGTDGAAAPPPPSSPSRSAAPVATAPPAAPAAVPELHFGRFGRLALSGATKSPAQVVILISGEGGFDAASGSLARTFAAQGALVVGVDLRTYRRNAGLHKDKCTYVAADLEALSKFVQKSLDLPAYHPPVLAGAGAGATLAYAALAQAPPTTFRAALSLGFCPWLDFPKPLCAGHGLAADQGTPGHRKSGWTLRPAGNLEQPWIALAGDSDKLCPAAKVALFVRQVAKGRLVQLSGVGLGVGHAFSEEAKWRPALERAYRDLTREPAAPPRDVATSDLPLVEVPAAQDSGGRFALMLSGDGGWAGIDRDVSGALAAKGIPVVGWNTLSYFWTARTPAAGAKDLERVLRHYLAAWKRERVILLGYSLGADVLPFFAARLPPDLLARVEGIALLGPSRTTAFEFHVSDWLGGGDGDQHPVLPEVKRLAGKPILCLYGREEDDSLCPTLVQPKALSIAFSGSHHFGGDYGALAARILKELVP